MSLRQRGEQGPGLVRLRDAQGAVDPDGQPGVLPREVRLAQAQVRTGQPDVDAAQAVVTPGPWP
ncbi:hypothetical protein [Kitasatospora purpeofusca]|uniref:hypothetical protein n=1 Tax=Kitasatospora purpeofusca TaxID=67352 RepID=UPI003F4A8EB6